MRDYATEEWLRFQKRQQRRQRIKAASQQRDYLRNLCRALGHDVDQPVMKSYFIIISDTKGQNPYKVNVRCKRCQDFIPTPVKNI